MAEDTKFTKEEMDNISKIQETYLEIQQKLGQVALNRLKIDQQVEAVDKLEEELLKKFTTTQKEEKDFVDGVTKKYGDGTLDPESGIFKSSK
tara:strand:- start:2171 stop:2446 length:276 start_codon:yes stop_codon:yes gene_type:complete